MSDASVRANSGPESYYSDEACDIYCGDSTLFNQVPDPFVLITDPPYGFGRYETDVDGFTSVLAEWVSAASCAAVFGYPEALVAWCGEYGLKPVEWVTWWPTNKFHGRDPLLQRTSEHIAIFGTVPGADRIRRPRQAQNDKWMKGEVDRRGLEPTTAKEGDVWRDPQPGVAFNYRKRRHPNEKPLSVMDRLVILCSEPGETIFDPFMGSGTTLEAAKRQGRKAIGVELEQKHCAVAVKRLAQEVLAV